MANLSKKVVSLCFYFFHFFLNVRNSDSNKLVIIQEKVNERDYKKK
jgi:hypothetical protein